MPGWMMMTPGAPSCGGVNTTSGGTESGVGVHVGASSRVGTGVAVGAGSRRSVALQPRSSRVSAKPATNRLRRDARRRNGGWLGLVAGGRIGCTTFGMGYASG